MTQNLTTVAGFLKPDGTLELSHPIHLPPGPVEITVKVVEQSTPDTLAVLQRIWAEREADPTPRRTKEEIDAYVDMLRDELEEHIVAAEELQRACRLEREKPPC